MSIALVQSKSANIAGNTSGSLAFNSNVAAGNMLIVVIDDAGASTTTFTISDGVNTYNVPTSSSKSNP